MRLLHVITSLRTGGAEHLMVDLLPALRDLGNEVELVVFDGQRTAFFEQLEQKGIAIHSLGAGGNVYHPRNILKLAKKNLVIVDGYADKSVLDIIKDLKVNVKVITKPNKLLKKNLIKQYNKQYNNLQVIYNDTFHDRKIWI